MPIQVLFNLFGVLAKQTPATEYDREATTHNIDENKSKLLPGPTKTKSPTKPIRTPMSFEIENSFLNKEKRINAVRIGTVA